ncbi:MAG: TIGR02099 family protein [Burkholderiales bacterium]|nr:TIGR02099 family protein [Burkholderiales bacterium]
MAPSLALRLLRFAGNAILALVAVFCALLLAIRYLFFPAIDDYRAEIAAELGRQLGAPVTIDAIAGGWDGWNPRLGIKGFAIRDRAHPEGPPVLLLPQVDLVVAWTSLVALDLRLKEFSIERPELSIRRGVDGRLHVAGVEFDPDAQSDDSDFIDWLLRQRLIVVRNASLTWNDELRGSPQLVLEGVMFRLQRSFGRHQFALVGSPPSALASPLDFRGEVSAASFRDWRDATGRFYVRLDYADAALWREWIPPLRPVASGYGAFRAWFDFAGGRPTSIVADLELTGVRARAARDLPLLDLTHLAGRVKWERADGKTDFSTQGLTFGTESGQALAPVAFDLAMSEGADGEITGGTLTFDRLEVAPLSTLALHLPLPEYWRRDLAALALRGSVTGGKFTWTGPPDAPNHYSGSGIFSDFGIAASESLPGAQSVSGSFNFDERHGELKLDSRDMRVALPRVFGNPLAFNEATGRVDWARDDDGLRISAENVRFVTPHTAGTANGSWRSRPQGPGIIDLKAQLSRADARYLPNYLPLTLDHQVSEWLRLSIKQGTASDIRISIAGDLADFPFADAKRGQFLVQFKATGVTLDYADGWPEVTDLKADVRFEGAGMTIDISSGRIAGAQVGPVKADIPQLGIPNPVLNLTGNATGSTVQFLTFIAHSPLADRTGRFTDGVQATGDGTLGLRFSLPLGKAEAVEVVGDYQLIDNHLRFPGLPALEQVSGHLEFTENSMQSRDLAVTAFGGTARVAVSGGDGGLRISANGTADLAGLQREFDVAMLQRVSGITDFAFAAQVRDDNTHWTLESALKGVTIVMPAPLGKSAAESTALRIERREVAGKPGEDLLTVDYGGEARLLMHRTLAVDGAAVDRALLLLGPAIAGGGVADRSGLWVRGRLAEFDLDEWMALRAKYAPKPGTGAVATHRADAFELNGVDFVMDRLDIFGRSLHDLGVVAVRAAGEWRLTFSGPEVEGTAKWRAPTAGAPNGYVQARLARLARPGSDELHPAHSEIDVGEKAANTWPELDIVADAFVSRGSDLGRLELRAQPVGPDWRIAKLALSNPAGRIDANGWWRVGREPSTTDLEIAVNTENAGAFLERFGYPVAVLNAPTKITGALAWNGAPSDFDYPTLGGKFSMKTGPGQFTKIDPGLGKLLSLLSLQALPRRITLDFRDVFSEGFAFDEILGDFTIRKGQMHTGNLRLDGPAATVSIVGDIDLEQETTHLDVRVKPALSTTFSAGAAALFIANPIVGAAVAAGTLLAQKLLDDPLGQMFSYDYRVTGPWADPLVERVGTRPEGSSAAGAEGVTR